MEPALKALKHLGEHRLPVALMAAFIIFAVLTSGTERALYLLSCAVLSLGIARQSWIGSVVSGLKQEIVSFGHRLASNEELTSGMKGRVISLDHRLIHLTQVVEELSAPRRRFPVWPAAGCGILVLAGLSAAILYVSDRGLREDLELAARIRAIDSGLADTERTMRALADSIPAAARAIREDSGRMIEGVESQTHALAASLGSVRSALSGLQEQVATVSSRLGGHTREIASVRAMAQEQAGAIEVLQAPRRAEMEARAAPRAMPRSISNR